MNGAFLVLTGLGPKIAGLRWETATSMRIGRQGTADVVLRDFSVERFHAEVKNTGSKWIVRDLADNDHYPTLVNGTALAGSQQELHEHDLLQIGQLLLKVTSIAVAAPCNGEVTYQQLPAATYVLPNAPVAEAMPVLPGSGLLALRPRAAYSAGIEPLADGKSSSIADLEIQAVAQHSWDQAIELVADDHRPKQGQAMLTLLRATQHLCNLSNLDDLLQSVLTDALAALGAQHAAILLVDPETDQLLLRATASPSLNSSSKGYSKTLVERCFRRGESLVCRDVHADEVLLTARSVKHDAISSAICALLRTPRKRLGVLHLHRGPLQEPFTEQELHLADAIAASVAVGIECAQVVAQQREQFVQTVTTLARAVELRDQHTGDHTKRVTSYALMLADALKVPQTERYHLQIGTPLHDIGKIGIDDAILRKPGKLTPAEFDTMKGHTTKGAAIVESIGSLNSVIPIVRNHHERWDGTGYPDRLGREQIALTARIVAVADAFDAMTSHRPYRPAMPPQLAFLEILSKAGTHFDPTCVQAMLRVRPQIESMLNQA